MFVWRPLFPTILKCLQCVCHELKKLFEHKYEQLTLKHHSDVSRIHSMSENLKKANVNCMVRALLSHKCFHTYMQSLIIGMSQLFNFHSDSSHRVKTCLFKCHLLMKQQREDSREVFRLTVLAHEAHAEVDVIFDWQMNTRTRNLRSMHQHILVY